MAETYRPPAGLPEYERPPVDETALGVEFPSLPAWKVIHYGLFYRCISERYPNVVPQPPIPSQIEEFGKPPQAQPFQVMFSQPMDTRCWFIDPTDSQLLQVQADRFLRNWRKRPGQGEYPRYARIRGEFIEDFERYLRFLRDEHLGEPAVRQVEVTYVNHVEQGSGWTKPGELHEVISFWREPREGGFLPAPESGSLNVSFRIPDALGRLHFAVQPAVRITDGKEILQLTITVRARPDSPAFAGVLRAMDLCHEWAVRSFDELTTLKMHRLWGKRGAQ